MLTVWKYKFENNGVNLLDIPIWSKILSFQTQGDEASMWVLVDTLARMVKRTFLVCNTGAKIKYAQQRLVYIGTGQVEEGARVYHVFEIDALASLSCK